LQAGSFRAGVLQELNRVAVGVGYHRNRDARTSLGDRHGWFDAPRLELRHKPADIWHRDREIAIAESAGDAACRRFCLRGAVELQQRLMTVVPHLRRYIRPPGTGSSPSHSKPN